MCLSAPTMMAVSTGVSIAGQLAQGLAARKAANAQAKAEELQAAQTLQAAQDEALRIRKAGERATGAARAQLAASGIDVNSGSALTIEDDITGNVESDAYNVLLTGDRRSTALRNSAAMSRAAGRQAMFSSVLGSVTTGLQGWKGIKNNKVELLPWETPGERAPGRTGPV